MGCYVCVLFTVCIKTCSFSMLTSLKLHRRILQPQILSLLSNYFCNHSVNPFPYKMSLMACFIYPLFKHIRHIVSYGSPGLSVNTSISSFRCSNPRKCGSSCCVSVFYSFITTCDNLPPLAVLLLAPLRAAQHFSEVIGIVVKTVPSSHLLKDSSFVVR